GGRDHTRGPIRSADDSPAYRGTRQDATAGAPADAREAPAGVSAAYRSTASCRWPATSQYAVGTALWNGTPWRAAPGSTRTTRLPTTAAADYARHAWRTPPAALAAGPHAAGTAATPRS